MHSCFIFISKRNLTSILVLVSLVCHSRSVSGDSLEASLKAAYLFKFTRFITWPHSVLPPKSPVVVCLWDGDPFSRATKDTIETQSSETDRPVKFRSNIGAHDLRDCHMVYVPTRRDWAVLLPLTNGHPVLTIADSEEFTESGGMIAFELEGQSLRFSVNLDAAEAAGLRVSSRMLSAAKRVISQKVRD
jgi:hypothetical protein